MDDAKRRRLEAAGWRVGDAEDYIDWLCDDGGCGHSEIVGDGGGGAAVVAAVGCAGDGGGGRC